MTLKVLDLNHDSDCGINDLMYREYAEPINCTCGSVVRWYETELNNHRNAILESAALVAEQVDNCHSSTYDNGGTEDGYRQAKSQIADAIRALKVYEC